MAIKYSDKFFEKVSTEYNKELSELCASLMLVSFDRKKLGGFFKKNKFEYNFFNYDTSKHPTSSAGFVIAYKQSRKYGKICIIVVRGTVKGEWYSNFDLYKTEDLSDDVHFGFGEAAKDIIEECDRCFCEQSEIKFLVTGHSRGGAVANIVSEVLTTQKSYTNEGLVYCYTFATPNVSKNANTMLKNIYNFVNDDDIITAIPLNIVNTDWSYNRNGQTINMNLYGKDDALNKRIIKYFKTYTGEEFSMIDKGDTLSVVAKVRELSPSPDDYYRRKSKAYSGNEISVYEYFKSGISKILSGSSALSGGLFLMQTKSGDFRIVTDYLMKYASTDLMRTSKSNRAIECNHSKELYYSFVKAYNKQINSDY